MNYIKLRKNNLCVEGISALTLTKKYKTPFYCYSLSQLKSNFYNFSEAFKNIKPLICFSVKSNSNITLLNELKKIGSGADVVSGGELIKAIKAGIDVKKIVFSGVGKTAEEIELAIKKKVLLINMESESEANLINKISKKMNKETSVGIRLNPNVIGKTNKKISTGGKEDKFGLSFNDFVNLCKKIKKMENLSLKGISVHIGSQITNTHPFKKVLNVLNKIINKIDIDFKYIDLGGGMGIPYSNKEKKLDLKKYSKIVNNFLKNKKAKIIFEPGRFIAGDTSILISKVIYIKKSNNKNFIILDAGMNDLMRPALYNAKHKIIPLKKNKKKIFGNIEFVGPICESSDKFLTQKNYPKINEGDYVAITDVGAYGISLASNYNTRPIIAEILVNGSKHKLIKKKQSLKSLINN
ncbi:diaminopimelate decarboxylase [Pelagibacteraceae bacterium]|jgi:diaminopimelate decarboxylase|nr:diaminopimelate decarboxylase [Pelagibacteraceae bacterium]